MPTGKDCGVKCHFPFLISENFGRQKEKLNSHFSESVFRFVQEIGRGIREVRGTLQADWGCLLHYPSLCNSPGEVSLQDTSHCPVASAISYPRSKSSQRGWCWVWFCHAASTVPHVQDTELRTSRPAVQSTSIIRRNTWGAGGDSGHKGRSDFYGAKAASERRSRSTRVGHKWH